MQKHVKKESNMQTALQKVVMTLKIKHIHMKKATQHPQITVLWDFILIAFFTTSPIISLFFSIYPV